jgi:hypothetical protein
MILPETATPLPSQEISQRMKTYDALAGSAMLRRAGRAAPLRGDATATLLAARRAADADDRLGRQLQDFYQSLVRQPVPDRFVALIDALEAQDAG